MATKIAEKEYNQNPNNRTNSFNLALYYLAAGEFEQSNELYRSIISNNIPDWFIQDAIKDLREFVVIFPKHEFAQTMRDVLSKVLQE